MSVYLPTKDRLGLLRRAVESVLSQDYAKLELIVVDDASSDGTRDYLRAKAAEDPRLKFRSNERNVGACHSRNMAIGLATGEFITGLDDDDYFLPTHISTLLRAWSKRGAGVVALFPHAVVAGDGGALSRRRRGKVGRKLVRHQNLLPANRVGNQLFVERETLLATGGFDPDFPAWQDLECWYRLLRQHGAAECSGAYTYVVDEGHDLGRITTSGVMKISSAYERFAAKHALTWLQKGLLFANYRSCVLHFLGSPAKAFGWRAFHFAVRVVF